MKTMPIKAALVLLLAALLVSLGPASAWMPTQEAPSADKGASISGPLEVAGAVLDTGLPPAHDQLAGAQMQWVPTGATPGFYAARDNRNVDPAEYGVVGGHQSFYWDQLEPAEGSYRWDIIDGFIANQVAKGKKAAFGIITFNGRANQNNPSNPPIRVPAWVFAAGATKVTCPDGFQIPEYWNAVYKQKYRNFIAALAARYDGHPNVEFIQIGVGKFGETQPCDDQDNPYVKAALEADGLTEYTWPYIVNDITDMYADNFHQTKLLLPNAPRFTIEPDRRTFTDHAISRGVGLFPAGIYADSEWVDLRTKSGWNGVGKYDRILDQAGTDAPWVPVAFEMYEYMTPNPIEFFWGVAAALSRRADYVTLERDVLYEGAAGDPTVTPITANIEVIRWASQYMGKHINTTPSVWVLLRESAYADNYYPQKGNYSWWLTQDDSISQGRTVVATYRAPTELVRADLYPAALRPGIETRSELGPSREGWICRRTDQGSGNIYMGFKIDDRYVYGGSRQATITVTYFDGGYDSWRLIYDAATDANKVAGTITKTNSRTWKKATFTVPDARFANSQAGGTDFRIDCLNDGNEYIHMVDVRLGGGSGQTYSINLTTANGGWNLVSTPLVPTATAVADFLASIAGKYDLVQAYYDGTWHSYPGGDLTTINEKMGLWIHVTQNCTLVINGQPPTSTTINLTAANGGWNLIGWPSGSTRSLATALAGIAGQYDKVYAFHAADLADPWKLYNPAVPSYANDLQNMEPGKGYWIHVTADCSLVVPY